MNGKSTRQREQKEKWSEGAGCNLTQEIKEAAVSRKESF